MGREAGALHRNLEAVLEPGDVGAAGQPLRLALGLALDAGQQLGVRRGDLVLRQAVDALDVEAAGRDGHVLLGLAASRARLHHRLGGGVAVEADHEQAVGRGLALVLAVDPDLGPGRGAADGVAALLQPARQGQRRRLGRRAGDACETQDRRARQGAAAGQALDLPFSSRHRWVASLGPA